MSAKEIRIKCSAVSETRLRELRASLLARFHEVTASGEGGDYVCLHIQPQFKKCYVSIYNNAREYINLTSYDEALYDVAMALISQYPLLPAPDPLFDIKLLEPVLFRMHYDDTWQAGHYSHRDNDKFIVSGHHASYVIRLSGNEMHVGSNTILPGWFIIEDNKIKWHKREVIEIARPDKKRAKGKR
jgi:hypothetical protein